MDHVLWCVGSLCHMVGLRPFRGRTPVAALIHVVRAFESPEIVHPEGSVDPARDVENLDLELVLADLDLVSRRLERLAGARKRGLSADETLHSTHAYDDRQRTMFNVAIPFPGLNIKRPLRRPGVVPRAVARSAPAQ